jgi:catechol 2,3-dioxygenase-like lactoylglutathione lyase family enzyme
MMKSQIGIITLGVNDLNRSLVFYRDGLGLPTKGITGDQFKGDDAQPAGAVVMFHMKGGLILALYPRRELAKDARHTMGVPSSTEFSLGYITTDKGEVDQILNQAKAAGATITDAAHDRPWGIYSGYFKDLDGHLWEVIWSPPIP